MNVARERATAKTVLVFQHSPCETLGTIADALDTTGVTAQYIRPFIGEPIPTHMGEASGLIVMGGPMGVYERSRYPFLLDEMRLIEQAIRADKPVLGVCLGSQVLAATLGAKVVRGKQKEIGWYRVTLTESVASDRLWVGVEPAFLAFHWHGDIFDLPSGAVLLASSDLTSCQAFRYGRNAYGLLFHLEVTEGIVQDMVNAFSDELREAKADGAEILSKTREQLPRLRRVGGVVFRRWANLLEQDSAMSAQAGGMMTQSIRGYYGHDHDRLDDLFKQFQAFKRNNLPKAKNSFRRFKIGLQRHIVWEEEILFPLFEEKTGMKGMGPTEVMRMEHRQIKQLLEAIHQNLQRQDSEHDSEEAALLEVLGAHNQKEEQILYPAIDQQLSEQERRDVFAKMERVAEDPDPRCCGG
ncbi:MAG: hemerythrin domain-containing protein [Candidatus Omnitrophica bacterium]|nr:hemerythrin domain-containing protein [Candidatus Omnitrophota bacterium]